MDISLPNRVNVVALLLGAALVAMSVSAVGAPLSLAAYPVMRMVEVRVNSLVSPLVTLLNCVTVGLVFWALRWASARGATQPTSLLGKNETVFASARVVAMVYIANIVVGFIASEIRWFFEVPVFNATQLSVQSVQGRVFMTVVLPLIGVGIVVAVAPRIVGESPRRAV